MEFSSAIFSVFILVAFVPFLVWSKREKRYPEENLINWRDLANEIFSRDLTVPESVRVKRALELGAKVLGFENALICAHNDDKIEVLLGVGKEAQKIIAHETNFNRKEFLCGELSNQRKSLAVEWVNFTDWRNHSAHTKWGWGAYLGRAREGQSNKLLTIGFFDCKPRDKELSNGDKEFMENLSRWLLPMAERANMDESVIIFEKIDEKQIENGNI